MKYPDDFMNKIICGDCQDVLSYLPCGSVSLIISSPPYFNLREYSQWDTYNKYLLFMQEVSDRLYRVLEHGRCLFWNIQDSFPKRLVSQETGAFPISADFIKIFESSGFVYESNIVWYKGKGGATQRMFGSYPYPPTFLISHLHENILMFRKSPGHPIHPSKFKEESKITKQEWVEYTSSLWQFNPETRESRYNNGHPAPFPLELPKRIIKMWSFIQDVILDPFMGSGTTAVAAKELKRNYIGIETHSQYCKIAEERLAQGVL